MSAVPDPAEGLAERIARPQVVPDLRQYFPKGTNLVAITQDELDAVAAELNSRPRQTLGWWSPSEKFDKGVRSLLETATDRDDASREPRLSLASSRSSRGIPMFVGMRWAS
jgi:hypothetical protein